MKLSLVLSYFRKLELSPLSKDSVHKISRVIIRWSPLTPWCWKRTVKGAWILSLLLGKEPPRRTTDQDHETQCEWKRNLCCTKSLSVWHCLLQQLVTLNNTDKNHGNTNITYCKVSFSFPLLFRVYLKKMLWV